MTRLKWLLVLPALLIATSGPLMAAEIKDKAGLFSEQAIKKALSELDRVEQEYKVPVTIETVKSLDGEPIREVTTNHARQAGAKGIYVMIAKNEGEIFGEASKTYRAALTPEHFKRIAEAFNEQFKKKDFDAGLLRGVGKIESTVAETRPAAPARRVAQAPVAGRNSSGGLMLLLYIGLGILALFLVIRVLGAIFSGGNRGYAGQNRMMGPGGGMGGPGYGQPGYGGGGGGGGFMSSMMGGIGGTLAGNWLYDQFSGRHHDTSMGQSNVDPNAGAAPADAGPEWGAGGGGAEGDWGGGGGEAGGGGGGDWGGGDGGGGGGDWGGGGGGGDWGGGGGGDW